MMSSPERHAAVKGFAAGTAYSLQGAGAPVVLIHGVGMEQAVWAPQVAELARDHLVLTYDMLGHGGSQLPAERATLADYARQLARLLDHLKLPAANIVGHSMGALVALEFALTWPERCTRVAALNAVFMRPAAQKRAVLARAGALQDIGVQTTIDATIARWFGEPVPADLQAAAQQLAGILGRVHPLGYARTYQLFASCDAVHADRLGGLSMPALFMTGELDPNSSPAMSAAMAARAPRASLQVLPGARHMMNVTDPHQTSQFLRDFLAQPVAAEPGRSVAA